MTRHHITQITLGRTAPHAPDTFRGRPLKSLLAFVQEWQSRRAIERTLGRLSNHNLRDIGLTKSDVKIACTDGFDASAYRALSSAAQNRMGNW